MESIQKLQNEIKKVLLYQFNYNEYVDALEAITTSKKQNRNQLLLSDQLTDLSNQALKIESNKQNDTVKKSNTQELINIINRHIVQYVKRTIEALDINEIKQRVESIQQSLTTIGNPNINNTINKLFTEIQTTATLIVQNSRENISPIHNNHSIIIRETLITEIDSYLKQTTIMTPKSKKNAMESMQKYLNNEITFNTMNDEIKKNTGCFSQLKTHYSLFSKYSRVDKMMECVLAFNRVGNYGPELIDPSNKIEESNRAVARATEELNKLLPDYSGRTNVT